MHVLIYTSFLRAGGGHFGRDKTLHKICERFYWRDMTKDIKELLSSLLHPIAVKAEVRYQIGIDIVGPLKQTRKGLNR